MKKTYLRYLTALLLFGSNGIVASAIALQSSEIVLLRSLLGSALLLLLLWLRRTPLTFYRERRTAGFLIAAGISTGASWMFLYEAYRQIGVGIATLLSYCGPILIMAVSALLFREKLTPRKGISFLVVICGMILVNGPLLQGRAAAFGLFCGAMSAVTYALMVIFNKKAGKILGLENAALQLITSFLTVAVFVGIRQGFAIRVQPSDWLPILCLGLVNTGLGCFLYYPAIAGLPVQTVAVCGYLEPLAAVLLSALLLREPLSTLQFLGAFLILGGAAFAVTAPRRRQSALPHPPQAENDSHPDACE